MYLYRKICYWLQMFYRNAFSIEGLSALFSPFGFGVTITKIVDVFFKNTAIQGSLQSLLQDYWWTFLVIGLVIVIYTGKPKFIVSEKLDNRDITIDIVIGDIFSLKGAIVVGSNTTFDTQLSNGIISQDTIQGKFTEKYYNGTSQLDSELTSGLSSIAPTELSGQRKGKHKRYPLGTVVKLNPKNRIGYFLAIADINEHGNALGSFEGLLEALGRFWVFVGEQGDKNQPILIPVLGSGPSRLPQPR